MLLTILLAAALAAPPPAAPGEFQAPMPGASARMCPTATHQAEGGRALVRRLDRLPPGRLELAVLRGVGRCMAPVIVREGIGAVADPDGREPGRR
jgi:NaMN:DMB phosphoribosyltransferase